MARAIRPKGLDGDPWAVLKTLEPDVALLQETRPPPSDFGGHFHLNPTRRGWGTAIWSRFELFDVDHLPGGGRAEVEELLPALSGYVASAIAQLPDTRRITLISVHAYADPLKPGSLGTVDRHTLITPNAKAVWPTDLVWWLTREIPPSEAFALIGGDWNTSRLFDELYGPRGNQDFFDRMTRTGWREALRKFEDSEVRTFFREGRGDYQLDHIFVTDPLYENLTGGGVAASDAVLATSDHAPIVLDFEW